MFDLAYYRGKRVLVTGHTGFKGSWLCRILISQGARVSGFALDPPTDPSLFRLSGIEKDMRSICGDIRDRAALEAAFRAERPEVVLHLAAQPIVREGYRDPVSTYATNVMGTVNLLECVRKSEGIRSVLNVTTDKVYHNREWYWGYREDEELDGCDPYSNSKSCSELVTHSYRSSFFTNPDGTTRVHVSTARSGNVIGGGDFAPDRIIPDCVRAALRGEDVVVRNPDSIRPYQHVLEPLYAYLMIAAGQATDARLVGAYNVGPDEADCCQTGVLVDLFVRAWGEGLSRLYRGDGGPHEASFLKLDCSKLKAAFGWRPRWTLARAVERTVDWTKCWRDGGDVAAMMDAQIAEYLGVRMEPC